MASNDPDKLNRYQQYDPQKPWRPKNDAHYQSDRPKQRDSWEWRPLFLQHHLETSALKPPHLMLPKLLLIKVMSLAVFAEFCEHLVQVKENICEWKTSLFTRYYSFFFFFKLCFSVGSVSEWYNVERICKVTSEMTIELSRNVEQPSSVILTEFNFSLLVPWQPSCKERNVTDC